MKFSRIVPVVLLALVTTALPAQSVTNAVPPGSMAPPPAPNDVVSGVMAVSQDINGFLLAFSDMGDARPLFLFVGTNVGTSSMLFQGVGVVNLAVTDVFVIVPAGATTGRGDAMVYLVRPAQLDPSIEGFQFALQGLTLGSSSDVRAANPEVMFLVSQARY